MKECSKERGCDGKANFGSGIDSAIIGADKMAKKHGKQYALYLCPHCDGTHLTTKLGKQGDYASVIYVTTL